jgi:hypothetical protein
MNTKVKEVEMVYGIYYGKVEGCYVGPHSVREAGCVVGEYQTDESLIKHLIASDFLSQWGEYIVVNYGPSMHVYNKIKGQQGGIALVLMYEEDL